MPTRTEHDERKAAKAAVREAKRARTQTDKLAKTVQGDARTLLERLSADAKIATKTAKSDLERNPRRARKTATRTSRKLERASIRLTASGAGEQRELAASARKGDAKTIKQRRNQAKRVRGMAKKVALGVVAHSLLTPGDDAQREKAAKRRGRARRDPALAAAKSSSRKGR